MTRLISFLRSRLLYYHPRFSFGHSLTDSQHNKRTVCFAALMLAIVWGRPYKYPGHEDRALEPDYSSFPYNFDWSAKS